MDQLNSFCAKLASNDCLKVAFCVIVIVILVLLLKGYRMEGFLGEFQTAPLTRQRDAEVLAYGQKSRFAEFSSTNQGYSNPVSDTVGARLAARQSEHLTNPESIFVEQMSNPDKTLQKSLHGN